MDRRLRARFQELRDSDLNRAPDFEQIMSGPKGTILLPEERLAEGPSAWARAPWKRVALTGGLLAAAAAAGLIFMELPNRSQARFEEVVKAFSSDPALGAWRSPTDGLLRMPGPELLSTRPTLGDPRLVVSLSADPGTHQL